AFAGFVLAMVGLLTHVALALLRRTPSALTNAPGELPSTERGPPSPSANDAGLTARELEVLRALSTGARNSQIARDLGIAERTVKAHLANIYQKLGVESRAAAIAMSARRGLVREERATE